MMSNIRNDLCKSCRFCHPELYNKVNCKLFSHSKLQYVALGYAEINDQWDKMGEEKVIF